MRDRSVIAGALRWLRRSIGADCQVVVSIGSSSRPRIDRFVMILLATGLIQPVGLAKRGSQPDQITYAVVDDEDGASEPAASEDLERTQRHRQS